MLSQLSNKPSEMYIAEASSKNGIEYLLTPASGEQSDLQNLSSMLKKLTASADKKSFLVLKHNKYSTIPVENIAFFYVKFESSVIRCFDKQEYTVNYSLEQIQALLSEKQFYRLNRQYLINFQAVKEAEHFYGRKLIVNLIVSVPDVLLVSKEKVSSFLHWLDNR